jgi:predicted RNase H-like nuclease (RuvC/YqgF family)
MAEAPAPAPRLDPLEELRKQLSDQRQRIADLEQAMETLTLKNSKLEQLVEVKDKKIEAMKRSYVD